jgi:polyhydroxyalkanoate synthesis repressor PhaR
MPLIKRYSNRKLYDTDAKRYVTLEGVADLIRQGQEVHVVDHESGDDITALIQAQTIFELERRLKGGLPRSVLTHLIRAGSGTLNQLRDALTPADWKARVDEEIERRVQMLVERGQVAEQEGLALLGNLLAAGDTAEWTGMTEEELKLALQNRGIPTREELSLLRGRVEALAAELDQLADHHLPRPGRRPVHAARPSARRRHRRNLPVRRAHRA